MLPLNEHLLNQVLLIAYQAGKHLRRFYQQQVEVRIKEDNTPVTEADLFVSRFLTEKLRALFPNVPVLSEENCRIPFAERQYWQEYWLIDPLDGTQQFIDRTDQFAVLMTLVRKNKPALSVIHAPILSTTYYALKDFGAFKKQGEQVVRLTGGLSKQHRIEVSNKHRIELSNQHRIELSNQHRIELSNQHRIEPLKIAVGATTSQEKVRALLPPNFPCEFIVFGSSSLKSGLVAEGVADCYVRLGRTGEWDTAGAEVLLAETGGTIFDSHFAPLTYNQRETLINPHFVMVADKSRDWRAVFQFN